MNDRLFCSGEPPLLSCSFVRLAAPLFGGVSNLGHLQSGFRVLLLCSFKKQKSFHLRAFFRHTIEYDFPPRIGETSIQEQELVDKVRHPTVEWSSHISNSLDNVQMGIPHHKWQALSSQHVNQVVGCHLRRR